MVRGASGMLGGHLVAVAQLAERRAVAAKVAGSKPVGHPTKKAPEQAGGLLASRVGRPSVLNLN